MSKRWILAVCAVVSLALVGTGVAIGWSVWGRSSGEFERIAGELEKDLTRSRDALERADREVTELRERQQEIVGVVESAGRELSEAVARARTITDLLRSAIAAVERLEAITHSGGGGAESAAPP